MRNKSERVGIFFFPKGKLDAPLTDLDIFLKDLSMSISVGTRTQGKPRDWRKGRATGAEVAPRERRKSQATGAKSGPQGRRKAGQPARTSRPRERRKSRATGADVGNLTPVALSRRQHLSNRPANAARQASRSTRRLSNRLVNAAGRRRAQTLNLRSLTFEL